MDTDKLREELRALRQRIKPPAEWATAQDHLEQRQIAQRIRILEGHLERPADNEGKPR